MPDDITTKWNCMWNLKRLIYILLLKSREISKEIFKSKILKFMRSFMALIVFIPYFWGLWCCQRNTSWGQISSSFAAVIILCSLWKDGNLRTKNTSQSSFSYLDFQWIHWIQWKVKSSIIIIVLQISSISIFDSKEFFVICQWKIYFYDKIKFKLCFTQF